jgi:hypothetical protein
MRAHNYCNYNSVRAVSFVDHLGQVILKSVNGTEHNVDVVVAVVEGKAAPF